MNEHRVALVTGGARGIGLGIVERLHHDGFAVEIWDLNGEAAAREAERVGGHGARAVGVAVDVSDSGAVRAAAIELLTRWGRIDVLVNNAGWDRFSWFLETDEALWRKVIGVVYRGALNTCRYLGPEVVKSDGGRIINIGSDTAKLGYALEAVYAGAKGGIVAFTRALAREIGSTGTTVNVVCPGATDTPLLRESEIILESDPKFSPFFPDGFIPTVLKSMPLGRLGEPADIAGAVGFLAKRESSFITGQVLTVDGGQTMYYGM